MKRKYHSGTICKGVSNPQTSNAFTGCDKEEIPKCVPRRYRQRPKKQYMKENNEKKMKDEDEISKLIKAFPKDIAALDKRSVLAKDNSQGSGT